MKKLMMIKTAAGPEGAFPAGSIAFMSDELAENLVTRGAAEYMEEEPAGEVPVAETTEPAPGAAPVEDLSAKKDEPAPAAAPAVEVPVAETTEPAPAAAPAEDPAVKKAKTATVEG